MLGDHWRWSAGGTVGPLREEKRVAGMMHASEQEWSPISRAPCWPCPPHVLLQARNKDGHTALHLAVLHNRPAAARALLEAVPACGKLLDRKQRGPASLAKLRGHLVRAGQGKRTQRGRGACRIAV